MEVETVKKISIFKELDRILEKIENIIVGSGLLVTTIIVFVNVISRYLFSYSFSWVEEAARYIVVWVAMFGGALCIRRGAHVAIDIIKLVFPLHVLRVIYSFVSFCAMVIIFYFFYTGIELVIKIKATGQVSASMEFLPMYLLYLAIPLGSILMLIEFFKVFWDNIYNTKSPNKELKGGE